jgi:hypothetical protein
MAADWVDRVHRRGGETVNSSVRQLMSRPSSPQPLASAAPGHRYAKYDAISTVAVTNSRRLIVSSPTMTRSRWCTTIEVAGGPPDRHGSRKEVRTRRPRPKGFSMADSKFSAQFEKISDKAKVATDKLQTAAEGTREQLEADAANARDQATAAAEKFKDKAAAVKGRGSSQWREVRETWHTHVATARENIKEKEDELDAHAAARDADHAEDYAVDAIDFAEAAIDEAQYATLDAMRARAQSDSMTS